MRLAGGLLAASLALASCGKTHDEAAIRRREAQEIQDRLGRSKVALYRALVHVLRHRNYAARRREADAKREMEAADRCFREVPEFREYGPLLAGHAAFAEGQYRQAALGLRAAAERTEDPKKRAEYLRLAELVERDLPEDSSPASLVVWAGRVLLERLARLVAGSDMSTWAGRLCESLAGRIREWEEKFPSTEELKSRAEGLWERVK